MKKKIRELTLEEIEKLDSLCPKRFIRSECYIDCKYFDEKECDCKLSFINSINLERIDLDKEIEVSDND